MGNKANNDKSSIDDLVTHEGKLYKAKAAIETAEDWTAAHWTETTVVDIIASATTPM